MPRRRLIVPAILLTMFGVAIFACRSETDVETETGLEPPAGGEAAVALEDTLPRLRAAIERTDPTTGINGEVVVNVGETSTFAEIDIEGAESGAVHPWHVHHGDCDAGGGIVGSESAYLPLQVNDNGEAEAQATVGERLDPEADYSVNVHLSAAQLDSIIACGELVSLQGTPE